VVLNALHDLGLDQNTIVIYTSDHGEMLGEHGLWQKFEFYEASCGVPLLIRAPGVSRPGVCDAPVSQVALLPTLAELCGVAVTSRMDAPGIRDQLENPAAKRDAPVFAEYDLGKPQAKYMIREGSLKYTFWTHDMEELYDLRADPKEMTNLALRKEYAQTTAAMKSKLLAWYRPPELDLKSP
jgi:choline-sulfatase